MKISKRDIDLGLMEFSEVEGSFTYSFQMNHSVSRKKVSVFFETDSPDRLPTVSQKQFLQMIIDSFHQVRNDISKAFPDDSNEAKEKLNFEDGQYELSTLGIPLNIDKDPKWDLSFQHGQDKSRFLLCSFEGMSAVNVWLEVEAARPFLLKILLKIIGR